MGNALLDRAASGRSSRSRRPRRGLLSVLAAAALAVVVLLGLGQVAGLLPSWGNPFAEETVDRPRPGLQLALSDLAEYRAAQGSYQVIVDLEKDAPLLPGLIKGERTTYLALGTVDGVVDFGGLDEGAVQVDGTSVTITLPPPRLSDPAVDLEQSRVIARDRGVVDRITGAFEDSPTSEREVALSAQGKLTDAAAQSDLLRKAEDNTRATLTGLAQSFGYTDVTVRFDANAGT